ncbi:MAG: hypothetical protein IJT08_00230 [Alphaproteobacteria bacterium]|nr:hypothetical protein [Alphaproteobacteria bacterium]
MSWFCHVFEMRTVQIFTNSVLLFLFSGMAAFSSTADDVKVENDVLAEDVGQSEIPAKLPGFYGGIDLGADFLQNTSRGNSVKKKTSAGLLTGAFTGYNCQFGDFLFGVEGVLDFRTANAKTTVDDKVYSVRRKYGFGLLPRVGYGFRNDINGYFNFGVLASKYRVRGGGNKANPVKPSFLIGLGIEKTFGALFLRGEVNRSFKRNIARLNRVGISAGSYSFKVGGGYHF